MKRKYWKEIKNPKQDYEYWKVYDPQTKQIHYFDTEKDAFEFSSWNNIKDIYVMKECFN